MAYTDPVLFVLKVRFELVFNYSKCTQINRTVRTIYSQYFGFLLIIAKPTRTVSASATLIDNPKDIIQLLDLPFKIYFTTPILSKFQSWAHLWPFINSFSVVLFCRLIRKYSRGWFFVRHFVVAHQSTSYGWVWWLIALFNLLSLLMADPHSLLYWTI